VTPPDFTARTRLPAAWGAGAVDERLESVRRRWNQFGLHVQVDVAGDADGILLTYRLTVAGRPDPHDVHAAFRCDLDAVLAALATPDPADWDLAAMARAQDDARPPVGWNWTADPAV
jgi:hypothetical protein